MSSKKPMNQKSPLSKGFDLEILCVVYQEIRFLEEPLKSKLHESLHLMEIQITNNKFCPKAGPGEEHGSSLTFTQGYKEISSSQEQGHSLKCQNYIQASSSIVDSILFLYHDLRDHDKAARRLYNYEHSEKFF